MSHKYRGKDIETDRWVYGDLIREGSRRFILPYDHKPCNYAGQMIEVHPASVGMWTTISDEKSKEIYGGDIVVQVDSENVEIGRGNVEWLGKNLCGWYIDGSINDALGDIDFNYNLRIIGNTTDTPSLLGEKT